MSNPYQSPMSEGDSRSEEDRTILREIARYQRWVIFALLANIGVTIGANAMAVGNVQQENPIVGMLIAVVAIGVAIFAVISIFLLAQRTHGTGVGVACAIAMCIPCVSLIVLLVINQAATTRLKNAGIKVGFLGVSENQI